MLSTGGLILHKDKHTEQKQFFRNPKQTKEVVSFLYSIGFVRPLKQKRPVQDMAKILFCYDIA
jgi:hypothetical protein